MFALLLLAALLATALAGWWALRARRVWPPTLLAALTPLAALLLLQATTRRTDAPDTFELLGRFTHLTDTVTIGNARDAEVRIADPGTSQPLRVRVAYVPGDSLYHLRVDAAPVPVFLGDAVANAALLPRSATITLLGRDTLEFRVRASPWCRVGLRCDRRVLSGPALPRTVVRVPEAGWAPDSADFPHGRGIGFQLFTRHGKVYVTATAGRLLVDGVAPPRTATSHGGELGFGLGDGGPALGLVPDRRENHLLVFYRRGPEPSHWILPGASLDPWRRILVGAGDAPGSLPVVSLDAGRTDGTARTPFGVLGRDRDGWSWHSGGHTAALATGMVETLPKDAPGLHQRHGYLVRLAQRGEGVGGMLAALTVVWLLSALLLAANSDRPGTADPVLRTGLIGCVFALAYVRAALALRVAEATPHNGKALATTVLFLTAFALAAWAAERWPALFRSAAERGSAAERRSPRRWRPALLGAVAAAALVLLLALGRPGWPRAVAEGVLTAAAGIGGLFLLQRLLIARDFRAYARRGPLAMLDADASGELTVRHLVRATALLGGLVLLYVSLIGPWPLALGALGAVTAFALYSLLYRERRIVVRELSAGGRMLLAGATGAAVGLALAYTLDLSAVAAGALVAGLGLLSAAGARYLHADLARRVAAIRPYRMLEDVLLPLLPGAAGGLVARLLMVWVPEIRQAGIALGFAIALAAVLVLVRLFALLWQRRVHAALAGILRSPERRRQRGAVEVSVLLLLLPLLLYGGFVAADQGALLLYFSATLVATVVAAAAFGRGWGWGAFAGLVGVLLLFVAAMRVSPAALTAGPVAMKRPELRFAGALHPHALERQLVFAPRAAARGIVENLQHAWAIDAYAAAGRTFGRGYLGTPYSPSALPERVALTDNVFSVFVLSEHGWVGGTVVLLLYMALAGLLLAGARRAATGPEQVPRGVLLVALASFVAVPALYMTAANITLVPLTGQNMPLLGLRSGADALFFAWLAALALVALPRPAGAGGEEQRVAVARDLRRLRRVLGAVAGVFALVALAVIAWMWPATHARVRDFAMDDFAAALRELVARADVVVAGDSLAPGPAAAGKPGFRPGDLVATLIARSNALSRQGPSPARDCLDADPAFRVSAAGGVSVAPRVCWMRWPLADQEEWRGTLLAGEAHPAYVLTNGTATYVLSRDTDETAPLRYGPEGCTRPLLRTARAVELACERLNSPAAAVVVGDSGLVLRPLGRPGSVLVDGARPTTPTPLHPGDVLDIDGRETFVVDSFASGGVAHARWQDGALERRAAAGTSALLSQLDRLLAEGLRREAATREDPVELTLDIPLQEALDHDLARACAAAQAAGVLGCAVTVADPVSGDILALASWEGPAWMRRAARDATFLPLDPNLWNHPVASAIKPVLAAAVLARYPTLTTLEVNHPDTLYRDVACLPIGTGFRSKLNGYPHERVDWNGFLSASNNLYAATLGFLGAATPGPDGLPLLGRGCTGPGFWIGGRRAAGGPVLPRRADGSLALHASPLASNLERLFDVHVEPDPGAPPFDTMLWAPAIRAGALSSGPDLQRVSPQLPELALDRIRERRQLASFMIGGETNRWNNLTLTQAVSRIVTGRGIELRMLRRIGGRDLQPEVKPEVSFGPARQRILDGMLAVNHAPWGTAARYTSRLFASGPFVLYGKTGTLDEPEWSGSLYLFAGLGGTGNASGCRAAGTVFVEVAPGRNPGARAVELFRSVVMPRLVERRGWGRRACERE